MPHVALVSTLVAPLSTSISSTFVDVAFLNHVSYSHGIGNGFKSQSPKTSPDQVFLQIIVFHSNEDIMESLTAPDYS